MKTMKLWKAFLIAISVAILPFALVGVGQAQQMTYWCLTPRQIGMTEHIGYVEQRSPGKSEDHVESENGTYRHTKKANVGQNMDPCQPLLTATLEPSSALEL
jgi:hypothetical protein